MTPRVLICDPSAHIKQLSRVLVCVTAAWWESCNRFFLPSRKRELWPHYSSRNKNTSDRGDCDHNSSVLLVRLSICKRQTTFIAVTLEKKKTLYHFYGIFFNPIYRTLWVNSTLNLTPVKFQETCPWNHVVFINVNDCKACTELSPLMWTIVKHAQNWGYWLQSFSEKVPLIGIQLIYLLCLHMEIKVQ